MIQIIIFLVVIGVIWTILSSVFESLSDAVGQKTVIITIVLCIVAFFAYSWIGVLAVAVIGLGVAYLLKKMHHAVIEHDEKAKETARIKRETQHNKELHENELALQKELDANCRWLGYMNRQMWAEKLGNYRSRQYESGFEKITENFAKQMELQNILQNSDWFQPFLECLVSYQKPYTAKKLLSEVDCPQFHITHSTPDLDILQNKLEEESERKSRDIPPLLRKASTEEGTVYSPTEYALRLYGKNNVSENEKNTEEFSFDEL